MIKSGVHATAHEIGQLAVQMKDLAQLIAGVVGDLQDATPRARFFQLCRLYYLSDKVLTLSADLQNQTLTIDLGGKP